MNPDFGQVEADPSVVNLTAYETFYEEKRPFFLEGRKLFDFGIEDEDQLFYSRRIGRGAVRTCRPLLPRRERADAREHDDPRRRQGHGQDERRALGRACCRASRRRRRPGSASGGGSREPVVAPFGSYTVARLQKDWDKGNTILGGMLTSTHRFSRRPHARDAPDPGVERRARLHALLRRPRVAAGGSRHPEPGLGRPGGDPGAAAEPRPLLPARRGEPPGRRSRRHVARGPRRLGAARHLGQGAGCGSPTTSTGTRRGSTSTTSGTCARRTSR